MSPNAENIIFCHGVLKPPDEVLWVVQNALLL
jgi:hypothetical protein